MKNHRRRIVSETLLSEYAYCLREGGRLYAITDVEELHGWHVRKLDAHPLFRRLGKSHGEDGTEGSDQGGKELMESDPAVRAMVEETEEGKKVARAGNSKYWAVFERIPEAEAEFRPLFS